MITILANFFIKNHTQLTDRIVRTQYGMLCGLVGVLLNIFLFAIKLFAGIISHSISITADAFNNLSDAGSSIISLIGFKLSNQKADPEHPFGHGRFEYISGFIVSIIIIVMAFELVQSSIKKIITPTVIESSPLIIGILILSILVKLYMAYYNFTVARLIDSTAMRSTALDSVSDCIATTVVLLIAIASHITTLPFYIDGICGIVVAIFIFWSGCMSAKDTMDLLLGQAPSKELVEQIQSIVLCRDDIIAIHDLIVHDYGPGRLMITLHAEVDADCDILAIHDVIDNVERELSNTLSCIATIHMDPIKQNDPETQSLQLRILQQIQTIDPLLTIHDFRIVEGPTHTNLLFDVEVPFHIKLTDESIETRIKEQIKTISTHYFPTICIDRRHHS